MSRPGPPRAQLLAFAALVLLLVVVQVAVAGSGGATKSASLTKQIKSLKQRVAALEARRSPSIPTSLPPTGAAGGDLSGTYPNPSVSEGALNLGGDLTGTVSNAQLGGGSVGTSELATFPAARALATSGQSIPNNSDTDVALNAEGFDTASLYQPADDTMIVPIDGTYLLLGRIFWAGNATGTRRLAISVNHNVGVVRADQAGNTLPQSEEVTTLARLQANDEIGLIGFQNSGGSLSTVGAALLSSDFASLSVQWLGP